MCRHASGLRKSIPVCQYVVILLYNNNREGQASPAGHLGERFGIVCICSLLLFSKILFQVYPTPSTLTNDSAM